MGGSNFGFADGHAKWWQAEAYLAHTGHTQCPGCADIWIPGVAPELEGNSCWSQYTCFD